ncbi:pyridoxal-phosphate dependent enzyme [Streptosporangium sp. NPDC087985]|uniref:pyridoxal-phosphate dependent enzyme n=1 Tax=Streptosporangium sp. NPDC087985 TaxID=3366196 RepID=UPI0038051FC2
MLEQTTNPVDTVVVAVGGGLMPGVAAALEDRPVRVVAGEPETAPTLRSALDIGQPTDVPVSGVAADSLGARRVGEIAFDVARRSNAQDLSVSFGLDVKGVPSRVID